MHSAQEHPWIACGISDRSPDGNSFSWDGYGPMSPAGGQYRLCWCAAGQTCTMFEDFKVDVGELRVIGPSPLDQDRTCVAGMSCVFSGITGQHLQDGDLAMVLSECGKPAVPTCEVAPWDALSKIDCARVLKWI